MFTENYVVNVTELLQNSNQVQKAEKYTRSSNRSEENIDFVHASAIG